jgi:hypothetical protein
MAAEQRGDHIGAYKLYRESGMALMLLYIMLDTHILIYYHHHSPCTHTGLAYIADGQGDPHEGMRLRARQQASKLLQKLQSMATAAALAAGR